MVLGGLFRRGEDTAAPRVPEGTVVYAIGDIHGQLDLLRRLETEIQADAAKRASNRRVVVYVGDYIDRGPASRGVIEHLIAKPLDGFEPVHLIGNHDQWLLDFLNEPAKGQSWLMNGGRATLASYGVNDVTSGTQREQMMALSKALAGAMPPKHLRFFQSLKHSHTEGDYFFAHAGVRPGVPLADQDPNDLIWIREEFLYSEEYFGKVVVHGHTPGHTPEEHRNRIAIDTGAFMTGRLTAVVLEGAKRRFLYGQMSLG
jgi:serine/threonine protein phosphatase 1